MKKMNLTYKQPGRLLSVLLTGLALALPWGQANAQHDIRGITGPTFNLYAFPFNINLPEGSSLQMWGFGDQDAGANATHAEGAGYNLPQYPGPTLVVTEDLPVTINLTNSGVPNPVSIVVTGHEVTSSCTNSVTPSSAPDCAGLLTEAAEVGETVQYTFTPTEPGTYIYHSLDGSNPGLHVEMGLLGVLIVRPSDFDAVTSRTAYGDGTGTDYEQEFLSLLTEVDPEIHLQMERGHVTHFTNSDRFAKVWFVNGRVFPDLFQGDYNELFPHQPYESLAQAHPGDRVLVRQVNAGQDSHPFHFHGENLRFIGRDGRKLSSDGLVADLGRSDNTINSAPKQTIDAIWTWSGKDLGWDIYGHDNNHVCNPDADGFGDATSTYPGEYCPDHGKAFPVTLPGAQDLSLGGWWSGSPFLGDTGDLPPGEGGLNPFGGYFFVWHSHAEKELTTFDIFPGGSLGAVVVLPPEVDIQ
jgi:FtsP/CotA-like multicopper oxidase with cupredoxin domain